MGMHMITHLSNMLMELQKLKLDVRKMVMEFFLKDLAIIFEVKGVQNVEK